ncbi:outer membrane protein 5 [Anaplasma centrale str. Israel]|uniref:Outer membrane protein 5 n=1 Tax=Anaplasma centrale (strain Israel) TaxID=574556 RepID=D1ATM2_ANACI|nr:P44/Msp2 family outer membrane protein [Anaplasma centrale]ACZ48900.1 outer membrane protein 5 [Anaplasma centrale str. Israel]
MNVVALWREKVPPVAGVCAVVACLPVCFAFGAGRRIDRDSADLRRVYVAGTASWTHSMVRGLRLGTIDGKTAGVLPMSRSQSTEHTELLKEAASFDWESPNPDIDFGCGEFPSFGWSAGYATGNVRVEFGMEGKRFPAKINGEPGNGAGFFLLLKNLTYALAYNGNSGNIAEALESCTGCQKGLAIDSSDDSLGTAMYKISMYGHDDARYAAERLVLFSSKDRLTAAKLLIDKMIGGGGEPSAVVEINDIEITAVMLSACYDAPSRTSSGRLTPYVCGSVGGNLVDVSGNILWKLAYRARLGVNYMLTQRVSVNLEAFVHKVPGEVRYRKFVVEHVLGDTYADQGSNFADVALKLSYSGCNLGLKLEF